MRVRCLTLPVSMRCGFWARAFAAPKYPEAARWRRLRPRRRATLVIATLCALHPISVLAEELRVSRIPDQKTTEDTPTAPIPIKITGDFAKRDLRLMVTSSNPVLIPDGEVTLGGIGGKRDLIVTPAPNSYGTARLELHVTAGKSTASEIFSVTVSPVNDAPTISPIADQTMAEGVAAAAIGFSIGDVETPAASLIVSVRSSNTNLLPVSAIQLGGSGAARTITLQPVAKTSGTASVAITVNDGEAITTERFDVRIGAVNQAPLVNAGPDQTLIGTNAGQLSGTATDDNLPAGGNVVTYWSAAAGSPAVSFSNPSALNTTARFSRDGIYTLRLTAFDGDLSGSDEVTIIVSGARFAAIEGTAQEYR